MHKYTRNKYSYHLFPVWILTKETAKNLKFAAISPLYRYLCNGNGTSKKDILFVAQLLLFNKHIFLPKDICIVGKSDQGYPASKNVHQPNFITQA